MMFYELTKEERQRHIAESRDKQRQKLAKALGIHPTNLMTTAEASAYLGVSRESLRAKRRSGKLIAYHVTPQVFFYRRSELDLLLITGKVKAYDAQQRGCSAP